MKISLISTTQPLMYIPLSGDNFNITMTSGKPAKLLETYIYRESTRSEMAWSLYTHSSWALFLPHLIKTKMGEGDLEGGEGDVGE